MIGKKPDMNWPASGSPAKKRFRSPWTTSPAALVKSPIWNQETVFTNWCMPMGISARLIRPNRPAPAAPRPVIHSPASEIRLPIGSHTRPKKTPTSVPTKAMMIGTRRRPLKKPSQSTSFLRWYRCHSTAASRPIRMPPRTPGLLYVAAMSAPSCTLASVTGKAFSTLL